MTSKVTELLREYANILEQLKEQGVVQTRNSPVGDYTEWLVAKAFGGVERKRSSHPGYDLEADGKRYQVKGRWLEEGSVNPQLGIIRDPDPKKPRFDFLIAVLFDNHFDVERAYKIPPSVVFEKASYHKGRTGYVLTLTETVTRLTEVDNITNFIRNAQ